MQLLAPTLSDLHKNSVLLGLVGYDRLQVIACAGIASHPNSSTTERPTQGVESVCVFFESAWLTIRSFFFSECWCKIVRFAHVVSHVTRHVV